MPTKLIYQPSGKAGEYAKWAYNVYTGCDHGCTYCYAPSVLRMDRPAFYQPQPRKGNFWANLRKDSEQLSVQGVSDHVLLSFTCDPYQALDVELAHTRRVIEILHEHGLSVCVLTKGGKRALRDVDLFTPADAFATTLTGANEHLWDEWHTEVCEPGAASPYDRACTLKAFHDAGIPTWVSLEPVFDPDWALNAIEQTHAFVDLYKVGMLNYHPRAKEIDWHDFGHRAVALLESLGKEYYIKADLRAKMAGGRLL